MAQAKTAVANKPLWADLSRPDGVVDLHRHRRHRWPRQEGGGRRWKGGGAPLRRGRPGSHGRLPGSVRRRHLRMATASHDGQLPRRRSEHVRLGGAQRARRRQRRRRPGDAGHGSAAGAELLARVLHSCRRRQVVQVGHAGWRARTCRADGIPRRTFRDPHRSAGRLVRVAQDGAALARILRTRAGTAAGPRRLSRVLPWRHVRWPYHNTRSNGPMSVRRLEKIPGFNIDRVAAAAGTDPDILRMENLDTDIPPPEAAMEATRAAIGEDEANSWLPFTGRDDLKDAVAAYIERRGGPHYDGRREIVITCGEGDAMLDALFCLTDPGDEVILTDPTYAGMLDRVRLVGATPRLVPLQVIDGEWRLDLGALR